MLFSPSRSKKPNFPVVMEISPLIYPSFSGSFIFTELEPVKSISWLNFGKVRLGWAQVGNDTDPYSLSRTYEYKNSSFGGVPNYGQDVILNNAQVIERCLRRRATVLR